MRRVAHSYFVAVKDTSPRVEKRRAAIPLKAFEKRYRAYNPRKRRRFLSFLRKFEERPWRTSVRHPILALMFRDAIAQTHKKGELKTAKMITNEQIHQCRKNARNDNEFFRNLETGHETQGEVGVEQRLRTEIWRDRISMHVVTTAVMLGIGVISGMEIYTLYRIGKIVGPEKVFNTMKFQTILGTSAIIFLGMTIAAVWGLGELVLRRKTNCDRRESNPIY